MVRGYTIAGRFVPAWGLSLTTLSVTALGIIFATSGKKPKTSPPIAASSPEEEKFILDFLKEEKEKSNH